MGDQRNHQGVFDNILPALILDQLIFQNLHRYEESQKAVSRVIISPAQC